MRRNQSDTREFLLLRRIRVATFDALRTKTKLSQAEISTGIESAASLGRLSSLEYTVLYQSPIIVQVVV